MLRILPLLLLLVCFVTACKPTEEVPQVATMKMKVVDIARIFRESDPGKSGVDFLNTVQAQIQTELAALQAKVQADPENMEVQQEIQIVYNQLQQRMNAEQQNVMNIVNDLLQRTLDEYRNKNKLELIVSSEVTLSYDKSLDITSEVIAEMNKHKVEYKSVAPTPKAADPAPATDPATPAEAKEDKAKPEGEKPADAKDEGNKPAEKKDDKPQEKK